MEFMCYKIRFFIYSCKRGHRQTGTGTGSAGVAQMTDPVGRRPMETKLAPLSTAAGCGISEPGHMSRKIRKF